MKELLEKILTLVPTFISELLRLVQGPKTFVAERLSKGIPSVQDSLVFLGISFVVGWVLEVSFIHKEPLLDLASDAAFVLAYVLGYGAALYLAWRIVKGRAPLASFFFIHLYYSGVLKLIASFWFLSLVGVMRVGDPALYKALMDSVYKGTSAVYIASHAASFPQSPAFTPLGATVLIGIGASLAWFFAGWGAYRELNHSSRTRSAVAAMLFALFCFPVTALVYLVANGAI